MSQQFDLSATKYGVVNPIYNAYKQAVPANARLLVKSLLNPSPVSEQNFSPAELETLRQSYANSMNRTEHQKQLLNKYKYNLKEWNMLTEDEKEEFNYLDKMPFSLQYEDYPRNDKYNNYNIFDTPLGASLASKAYSLQTGIGRANYQVDPQGNVHIVDKYDFPKSGQQQTYSYWSPTFKILHGIGEKFSRPMPLDINIGNPNRVGG